MVFRKITQQNNVFELSNYFKKMCVKNVYIKLGDIYSQHNCPLRSTITGFDKRC